MPSIHDVARKLNISITTVSRALDGYADVAAETRERVVQAAREMGYVPNRAARQLRRQRTETIGFILPAGIQRFSEPFFSEFIGGLGDELAASNYDLLVSAVPNEVSERDMYQRWVHGGKVDGIILNRARLADWRMEYLAQNHVPFASLGDSGKGTYPCVKVDGAAGFADLVRHIHDQGFRRFAFIGGPADLVNQAERLAWFRASVRALGLAVEGRYETQADLTSTGGYQAANQLFDLPAPPDAILCIDDETAFGALHAAHDHGLAIGRQVAVAGFDGVQDGRHTAPPLTTLDIPIYEIACRLVKMLLATLGGQAVDSPALIHPRLLIRESTGGKRNE